MRISPSLSPRNLRIIGASLIAVLMVAGGYVLPGFRFPETKAVNAELTDELLASYVAKDTDSDGLPDWQEVLYGTDANKADTDGDGISDGDAVRQGLLTPKSLSSQLPTDPIGEEFTEDAAGPDTITDQFSRAFFKAYMEESGGQALSQEDQQALLKRLLDDFNARAAARLNSTYTLVSVRTDPSVSVGAYAMAVENVLRDTVIEEGDNTDTLLQLQALIIEDDPGAKGRLERIAASQRRTASGLLAVHVPPHLAPSHLALVRSYDMLSKSIAQAALYKEDPLGILGALAVYQSGARGLGTSISGVAVEILRSGEPSVGNPGYLLVSIARSLEQ